VVTIRLMTTGDLPTALHLTGQAGWNQTCADWTRFLEMEPEGCFIANQDDRLVGITVTCVFGSIAWIAMVLVEKTSRRQGIATYLMKYALAYLDDRAVRTIRLDATETGERVYSKLGFVKDYQLARYGGTASRSARDIHAADATVDMLPAIVDIDTRVAGAHREKLLTRLYAESPLGTRVLFQQGQLQGFAMTRNGTNALQIGPCITHPSTGNILLADMLQRCASPILIDIPDDNAAAILTAESFGLRVQRHFVRMYRGTAPQGNRSMLWASSGPEKG
jgi:GNAT superfamily N-acetyltransferase